MTINHLLNKKYPILISLFCLCYGLAAQEVASASPIYTTLITTKSEEQSFSPLKYEISGFEHISDLSSYNSTDPLVVLFGKKDQEPYIFLSHDDPNVIEKNEDGTSGSTVSVIGFCLKDKVSVDKEKATKIIASSTSWGRRSFIVNCKQMELTFYYRQGWRWFAPEFIELDKGSDNDTFYKEKSDDNNKNVQLWEVAKPASSETKKQSERDDGMSFEKKSKDIVGTWHVKPTDKFNAQPSSYGKIYSTLKPKSSTWPYIKLNDKAICMLGVLAVAIAIVYSIFYKKEVIQFVNKYLLRTNQ